MPDLIRHPETHENTGCARLLRSLRLPSVARLESTLYLSERPSAETRIGVRGRNGVFYENRHLWTDTI
jgi:hypothetical protein